MPNYRETGRVPRKRHTQSRGPDGKLRYEELFSCQGFAAESSLLYHVCEPTDVTRIVRQPSRTVPRLTGEAHQHRRFVPDGLASKGEFLDARVALFRNDDVEISFASPDTDSTYFYRNGLGDELVAVMSGGGTLRTQFGALHFGADDLIVIPRGAVQEWTFDGGGQRLAIVESRTTIGAPARYLTPTGQFTEHSPFCERDLRVPGLEEPRREAGDFVARVRLGEEVTDYHLAWHPFDVEGWDGCVYPFALNLSDYEPVTRRIHTMPDDAQVFATGNAAICVLVPRLGDYHPDSVSSPPYHSSVDCDEVTIYLDGSGSGLSASGAGAIAFHPRGIPHGPKPGFYEASIGVREFGTKVLLIDTFRPLHVAASAMAADEPGYALSWHPKDPAG